MAVAVARAAMAVARAAMAVAVARAAMAVAMAVARAAMAVAVARAVARAGWLAPCRLSRALGQTHRGSDNRLRESNANRITDRTLRITAACWELAAVTAARAGGGRGPFYSQASHRRLADAARVITAGSVVLGSGWGCVGVLADRLEQLVRREAMGGPRLVLPGSGNCNGRRG